MNNNINGEKLEKQFVNMLNEVRNYKKSNFIIDGIIIEPAQFEIKMKEKYSYLFNSSNLLFKKCLNGELENRENYKRARDMITKIKKINNGQLNYDTVNKQMGVSYFNEFVKPIIDK